MSIYMNTTDKENNEKKEIKAKISIEVTEKGKPSIGDRICGFIYIVCLLSLAVFVLSTVLTAFSADPEHSGALGTVQFASILVSVISFWAVVVYKMIWDDEGASGGWGQYFCPPLLAPWRFYAMDILFLNLSRASSLLSVSAFACSVSPSGRLSQGKDSSFRGVSPFLAYGCTHI